MPSLMPHRLRRIVALLIVAGGLLRLIPALTVDPLAQYEPRGGDVAWYLAMGEGLLSGANGGISRAGIPYLIETLPTPPLYILFVGVWQRLAPPAEAVVGILLSQGVLSVLLAVLCADMARRLTQSQGAGLFVLAAMMLDPAQILEPRHIATETLYMTLIVGGLWALSLPVSQRRLPTGRVAAAAGVLLGLATLTRAVGLMFPLFVLLALGFIYRRELRGLLYPAVALLAAYAVVVGSWTAYNMARFDRFVIASNQMLPAIWRGAITTDGTPEQNDALLRGSTPATTAPLPGSVYWQHTTSAILADPLGYVRLRLTELGSSVLLPHATTMLPGESLRHLAAQWVGEGFSAAGLARLIHGDYFWLKLAIYLFQFSAYGLALAGAWRMGLAGAALPLSFIVYTLAIHLVLLALPRYIFPLLPLCWVLAGGAMAHWRTGARPAPAPAQPA